jgi:hypothetical protein
MAGEMGLAGCCCGPTCSLTATVTVRCQSGASSYTTLAGFTVDIKDGGGSVVASGTTNGSGVASITFSGAIGTYAAEASKTDYQTKTGTLTYTACPQTQSVTITTSKSVITINFTRTGCPTIGGATIAVTGDVTTSDTAASDGSLSLPITMPSGAATAAITITITPPSGHGAATQSSSITLYGCADLSRSYSFIGQNDGSHSPIACGEYFMPSTFDYSDDYGSCTLTYSSGLADWNGTYTYTSSKLVALVDCDPLPDQYLYNQTGSARVDVSLTYATTSAPGCTLTFTLSRKHYGRCARQACNNATQRRAVAADLAASTGEINNVVANPAITCGTTISETYSFGSPSTDPYFPVCHTSADPIPDQPTSATVTGTV